MKTIYILTICFVTFQVNAQNNNVRAELQDLRNKMQGLVGSVAQIKTNTSEMAGTIQSMKSKFDIINPDFFSPPMVERINNMTETLKLKFEADNAGIKNFVGPSGNCGPGTECFKFKNELTGIFNDLDQLKSTLLGNKGPQFKAADKLAELVNQAPALGLYPVFVSAGKHVNSIGTSVNELGDNLQQVVSIARGTTTEKPQPPGPRIIKGKGPSHHTMTEISMQTNEQTIHTGELNSAFSVMYNRPSTSNNENAAAIQEITLDDLCLSPQSKREDLSKRLFRSRELLLILKMLNTTILLNVPDIELEGGASLGGHVAGGFKVNPPKTVGSVIESILDGVDMYLDNVGSSLDQCVVLNNQKMINDNQKLIMEELVNLKAKLNGK